MGSVFGLWSFHIYWAHALEPTSHSAGATQQEKPPQQEARAPQWRVAPGHQNWRKPPQNNEDPVQPKIK